MNPELSTGLPELDRLVRGLIAGDNVVWQVDRIEDYQAFTTPFARFGGGTERPLVYFRFARHAPLLPQDVQGRFDTHALDPQTGFERFLDDIHGVIEAAGRGALYVFDCLSDLAADWFSDEMLGNFFRLTCPYLYDLETIAYFGLLRNYHSAYATAPIRRTTQLLLDVYQHDGRVYVRPLKTQQRHSPTMHMLHVREEDQFRPVSDSCTIADILSATPRSALDSAMSRMDVWNRAFLHAEDRLAELEGGDEASEEGQTLRNRLLRMLVSRDARVLELAERYFSLSDVIAISKRTIGTGLIGGKSVGMLLARAILRQAGPRWAGLLETHDSFFIASDVFYTFLVQNGCWWIRQKQKHPKTFLEDTDEARRRILAGAFPSSIEAQFADMLDYFGPAPIIVRSSSLLEDNFGNSFAGKYDSVFCPNQGARSQRLEAFVNAVKTIYASTMSEEALAYRARHGILDRDEQMALLVQRVSGALHGTAYYPQLAGVGFSFNPYAWNESIDPAAGVLRLVFGLGTRAVDRADDDYTRLIALNAPQRRPETPREDRAPHAQRKVDVLDLAGNALVTRAFDEVLEKAPSFPLELFAAPDRQARRRARELGQRPPRKSPLMLQFDGLIERTSFVEDMRNVLKTLENAYQYPVDIEFAANFTSETNYRIHLLQCRPLQVRGGAVLTGPPAGLAASQVVLASEGPVIGHSRLEPIDRIIYVVPSAYAALSQSERHAVARLIGRLTHLDTDRPPAILLAGPGRWGTSMPEFGVPVSFHEISPVTVLCEIVAMRDDLTPDVSFGTHFFLELVEAEILYMAVFPHADGYRLNADLLEAGGNRLPELLPDAAAYAQAVRVLDAGANDILGGLRLYADTIKQRAVCYRDA